MERTIGWMTWVQLAVIALFCSTGCALSECVFAIAVVAHAWGLAVYAVVLALVLGAASFAMVDRALGFAPEM